MAARGKPSKKRSASSSKRLDAEALSRLVFFLDHNLGRYAIANALRAARANVEVSDDHFASGTPDTTWLAEVGRRGWIVLSKDAAIKRRDHELAALKTARVRAFFLTSASMTGDDMAAIFVKVLPKIVRLATSTPAPFVFTVRRDGKIDRVV